MHRSVNFILDLRFSVLSLSSTKPNWNYFFHFDFSFQNHRHIVFILHFIVFILTFGVFILHLPKKKEEFSEKARGRKLCSPPKTKIFPLETKSFLPKQICSSCRNLIPYCWEINLLWDFWIDWLLVLHLLKQALQVSFVTYFILRAPHDRTATLIATLMSPLCSSISLIDHTSLILDIQPLFTKLLTQNVAIGVTATAILVSPLWTNFGWPPRAILLLLIVHLLWMLICWMLWLPVRLEPRRLISVLCVLQGQLLLELILLLQLVLRPWIKLRACDSTWGIFVSQNAFFLILLANHITHHCEVISRIIVYTLFTIKGGLLKLLLLNMNRTV